jgi:hypothetical protein
MVMNWQFAERAQITVGAIAKGYLLPFRLFCMRIAESMNSMQRRLCFAILPSEHQVEYKNGGEIFLLSAILILNKAYPTISLSGRSNPVRRYL